ncbi:MAG TPA: alkaline phosphatase family protein [Candidatus Nitrosotalea sp.]|nr:alkaline phosphatase family protein [Candidatus Nitrosotalea sp.]
MPETHGLHPPSLGSGKVQHVVIIFQENRSPDNLFNGLPGADTVKQGLNSAGASVNLQPERINSPWDPNHSHASFVTEFDGGKMDGFNLNTAGCPANVTCIAPYLRAYNYVPKSDAKPYWQMAEQYAFGDRMFATQEGPSFPAHQYIFTGAATISQSSTVLASENPLTAEQKFTGGCDSPAGSLVMLMDGNGAENGLAYPCFDRPAFPDLLATTSLTWRWYQAHPGAGLWAGPDAVKHIRDGSQFSNEVVSPPSQVLTDISSGNLANVVWVTPTAKASDHAGITNGTGPSWIASVVNAIGESRYWNSTVIFVTWDDWGGFYDHVPPVQYNAYELGFRVPLIAIGPYAKKGYVSHVQHEFGSILKFTEQVFGLGSLGATDVRADNLADCFNFSRKPRPFRPIQSPLGRDYFLRQPVSWANPDDE